jgi:hypothetical protein
MQYAVDAKTNRTEITFWFKMNIGGTLLERVLPQPIDNIDDVLIVGIYLAISQAKFDQLFEIIASCNVLAVELVRALDRFGQCKKLCSVLRNIERIGDDELAECSFDWASAVSGCIASAALCKIPCAALKRAFTSALSTRPSDSNHVKICCRVISRGPVRTILLLVLFVLAMGEAGMTFVSCSKRSLASLAVSVCFGKTMRAARHVHASLAPQQSCKYV